MVLGLVTIKPYKKLNKQYIGTQFFVLGIPLFPVNSYFFNDNLPLQNVEIGIHSAHVVKIYSTIFFLLFCLLLFIPEFIRIDVSYKVLMILTALAFLLILLFKYDKTSDEEKDLRIKLEQIVGINILPKEINVETSISLKNRFTKMLQAKLNTTKYINEILNENLYEKEHLPLIFVISFYEYRINPSLKNKEKVIYFYNEAYAKELSKFVLNL